MLQWISANIGTVLISLVLLAVVTLIIRSMVHDKKTGKVLLRRQLRRLCRVRFLPQ